MKGRILTSLLAVLAVTGFQAQEVPTIPRLVVGLTIDQLRLDYVEAFSAIYGSRGFKRLWKEARVYRNAEYDFNTIHLPVYEVPQGYKDHAEYLSDLTYKGLKKRFEVTPPTGSADDYMKQVDAAYLFPMHFWGDFSVCRKLKEHSCSENYRDRIVTIKEKGQSFSL